MKQQFSGRLFDTRACVGDLEKGLVVVGKTASTFIIFEVNDIVETSCVGEPGSILELPGFLACDRFSTVSTDQIFWPTKAQYSYYLSQVKVI